MTPIHAVNPPSIFGEMNIHVCKHCESEKVDHLDDGTCLFAPMKFTAMSQAEYFAFLVRPLAGNEALQKLKQLPNIINVAPMPAYPPFAWESPVYGPTTQTIGYYSPSTTGIVFGGVIGSVTV